MLVEEGGQFGEVTFIRFSNRQSQRFGQPARAFEQPFGFARHVAFLEVLDQHGGRIARVGEQPLPVETLLEGSAELTLLGARQLCPAEVPAELNAKLDAIRAGQAAAGASEEKGGESASARP